MNGQLKLHVTTLEALVPQGHFPRKLDAALELSFVRAETARLYSRQGRPAIDPVVLVKCLLVGCLYGIPSERQIEERINGVEGRFLPESQPPKRNVGGFRHFPPRPLETTERGGIAIPPLWKLPHQAVNTDHSRRSL